MSRFYNRVPEEVIKDDEHPSGLKTVITKYLASFSIGVYKGRYKVAFVYVSPYQRKYQNYTALKSEKMQRQFLELADEANEILESRELELMHQYKDKFSELREKYSEPSYPISTL